ncbi:MAG: hypothetical protein RIR89_942 [Actinomycetota bacterium]
MDSVGSRLKRNLHLKLEECQWGETLSLMSGRVSPYCEKDVLLII